MSEAPFDLILTVITRGFAGDVVDAARAAGAHGGTVLSARGSGIHETEVFFGIHIQPEKEIVLILVEHAKKLDIMKAIQHGAGLNTEGRGLIFSMPVDDVAGVVHMSK